VHMCDCAYVGMRVCVYICVYQKLRARERVSVCAGGGTFGCILLSMS